MLLIKQEEIDEISKDIEMTKVRNFENLKKASTKLNDIIMNSPQQLPIIFLIRKELNSFQINIDADYQNQNNNDNNNQFPTKNSIKIINEQSNKIYNIFNNMYGEYFYNQFERYFQDFNNVPIIEVIKDSENLIDLTKKNHKSSRIGLKTNTQKNSPKYWPLRIREALVESFKFNYDRCFDEIIDYFETNYQLFIFISKLKRTSDELVSLHKLLFPAEEENSVSQQSKIPKEKRILIDMHVRRLFGDIENQKSCFRYVDLINSKVDFNIFTEAAKKKSK